ncbi:hypothetical protein WJX74_008836 [Apatococcus lobatus]|uniref:Uncharacterized protein n=1 Tax=Apatococcus lobatus TaxID=904363 RepID=A0AAW1QU60_9CHLO
MKMLIGNRWKDFQSSTPLLGNNIKFKILCPKGPELTVAPAEQPAVSISDLDPMAAPLPCWHAIDLHFAVVCRNAPRPSRSSRPRFCDLQRFLPQERSSMHIQG